MVISSIETDVELDAWRIRCQLQALILAELEAIIMMGEITHGPRPQIFNQMIALMHP